MERAVVVRHEARVVDEAVFLHQFERRVRQIGRRRAVPKRTHADPLEDGERALHVRGLLVARLLRRIHVRVRVVRELVATLENRRGLEWKRLHGVAGDEEGRPQVVALERLEHARDTDSRAVLTAGEHRRRCSLVAEPHRDRKSTRLNSSHVRISYAVFCLKKKKKKTTTKYPLQKKKKKNTK